MTTTVTHSEEETAAVGRRLATQLSPGAVVLLTGDLGAGKTAFVRGLAEGLGIDPAEVSSPTFTLVQEYRDGRLLLRHVDLYRLTPGDTNELGLDDMVEDGGVVAVEWPDRWRRPPAGAIDVHLESGQDDERTITIRMPEGYSDR